jgi:hypothetical protein
MTVALTGRGSRVVYFRLSVDDCTLTRFRAGGRCASVRSIDRDHNVRCFDDSVSGLPAYKLQLVDRFIGNRCSHDRTSLIDADVRRGLTFFTSTIAPLRKLRALSFMEISPQFWELASK